MDCTFAEDIAAADADADCTASFWTYLVACLALPADDDSSCRLGKISRRCPKRVLDRRASTRALQYSRGRRRVFVGNGDSQRIED